MIKQNILRKKYLYKLCDDYVLSIADGTSVSPFCVLESWGLKK